MEKEALLKHETEDCQNRPELVLARAQQREKQYAKEREEFWRQQEEEEKQSLKRSYNARSTEIVVAQCNSTLEITLDHHVTLQDVIDAKEEEQCYGNLSCEGYHKCEGNGAFKRCRAMDPRLTLPPKDDSLPNKRRKLTNCMLSHISDTVNLSSGKLIGNLGKENTNSSSESKKVVPTEMIIPRNTIKKLELQQQQQQQVDRVPLGELTQQLINHSATKDKSE